MQNKQAKSDTRTEIGRSLARKLYDYKLNQLLNMSSAEKAKLKAEYPKLDLTEFNYVLEQVIVAKRYEQERIGWQAVPHDIAVLLFVALTCLLNLQVGAIAGVAALVLFESVFQFYFDQRIYRFLSVFVWLTYPAYVLLGYVLYLHGYTIIWSLIIVALTWGGSYLLGVVARLPIRLFKEARIQGVQEAVKRRQKLGRS